LQKGQYTLLQDRSDLWCLLAKIVTHKALNQIKKRKRELTKFPPASGEPSDGRSPFQGKRPALDEVADPRPSPDEECLRKAGVAEVLRLLPNCQLRSILVWKWEGYTNVEIAGMLNRKLRTVERKLTLIRSILARGLRHE
jgi:DNA-directed RNA polymerase specialized sigma24 family protein